METKGTTGEETTSYWFDLPIDVAEFEEKLGVGAESQDYRIIEKVLPFADEVHEHTSVYQLNELDFMYVRDTILTLEDQRQALLLLTAYFSFKGQSENGCPFLFMDFSLLSPLEFFVVPKNGDGRNNEPPAMRVRVDCYTKKLPFRVQ